MNSLNLGIGTLGKELEFESFLAELSMQFISLDSTEIDDLIESAQRKICEVLGLDRSAIWQHSKETQEVFLLTHIYQLQGLPELNKNSDGKIVSTANDIFGDYARAAYLQIVMGDMFPWVYTELREHRTVVIPDVDELPEVAAVDRETFRRYSTRATVLVPLVMGKSWLGCLTFASTTTPRNFHPLLVKRFEIIAHLFANAIGRRDFDRSLRENEARLSLTTEQVGAGLWNANFTSGLLWMAPHTRSLFGFLSEETVTYDAFLAAIQVEDRQRVDQVFQEISLSDEVVSVEFRVPLSDGSVRWIASRARRHRVAPGGSDILMGVSLDISDRKRLEAEARALRSRFVDAQEKELTRLAHELHDDITQRLARLSFDMGRLGECVTVSGAELTPLRSDLAKLSGDVHALAYRLHPSSIEDLGLCQAIQSECTRFSNRAGASITVSTADFEREPAPGVALCLFRIVQEALNNTARHAQADTVEVSLRSTDDGIELGIWDNGIGFNPDQVAPGPHLGQVGMRERVQLLDGEIAIESAPGQGTTIVVWLPLAGNEL